MASVRERLSKSGETTFAVLFRHGGKQTSITFPTGKAAEDFRQLVDILGPDKAIATLEAEENDGLTVDELFERWIDWKAGDGVTARTLADYRRDYTNYIAPKLGRRMADSVDELDVQSLVDAMSKRLDPKSVADRHMILGGMYRYGSARSRRLVSHNPCLETSLPKRKKKPPKGVTLAEWYAIHEAAQRAYPDAADLLLFIAGTGWRWSEAAALTVGQIEEYVDEHGVSHTYASMAAVWRREPGKLMERAEDEAKSTAGIRRVVLPAAVAAVVRRRSVGRGLKDLVFTNRHGRKWYQSNFLERTWTDILKEAGYGPRAEERGRPTPHWLRHTHVAMLDRAGASLPEMRRRLGHEDVQTTINIYGGMIDELSDDTLARLDAMLVAPAGSPGEVVAGEVLSEDAAVVVAELVD